MPHKGLVLELIFLICERGAYMVHACLQKKTGLSGSDPNPLSYVCLPSFFCMPKSSWGAKTYFTIFLKKFHFDMISQRILSFIFTHLLYCPKTSSSPRNGHAPKPEYMCAYYRRKVVCAYYRAHIEIDFSQFIFQCSDSIYKDDREQQELNLLAKILGYSDVTMFAGFWQSGQFSPQYLTVKPAGGQEREANNRS